MSSAVSGFRGQNREHSAKAGQVEKKLCSGVEKRHALQLGQALSSGGEKKKGGIEKVTKTTK